MEIQTQEHVQFKATITHYQNQLKADPGNLEIYRQLARTYILSGAFQDAVSTVQTAINLRPNFASIYLTVGNSFQETEEIDLAIWAYTQALEIRPDFAEAHANLGSMFYQKDRWKDAISSYKAALKIQPQKAEIHWMLGNTLMQLDRMDEAGFCYQTAVQLQPQTVKFHLKSGQNLLKRGRIEEALTCYQTVLTLDPQNQIVLEILPQLGIIPSSLSGNPLMQLSFISEASERFEEGGIDFSGQLDRPSSEGYDTDGKSFIVEAPIEAPVEAPENLVTDPLINSEVFAEIQAYQHQIETCFKQKNFQQVIQLCSQILKLQPDEFLAYVNLGNAYTAQGKVDAAIQAYQTAITCQAHLPEVHTNLGTLYTKKGQIQSAISAYQTAIQLQPDLAPAYWNLGKVYQQLKQEDEAINYWQKALELQPDLVEPQFNFEFGNALARRGKWQAAIESYQRVIMLQPKWAEAHANMGCVRSQQGNYLEAISDFQNAIEIKPDRPEFYLHYGVALVKLKRYPEAIAQYQNLIKLKPDSSDTYHNIANIYSTLGQVEKAIRSFEYALEFRPDWPEVHCRLAHIQKQDQPQAAVIHLEKAVKLKPDYIEAHQQLCDLLSHSTRLGKAREATDQYCKTCGHLAPVLSRIAYVFAYTQSGACEAALKKLLELEEICFTRLNTLSLTEINILYEILLFTLSHLRDDRARNAQFYQLMAEAYYQKRQTKALEIQANWKAQIQTRLLRIGFISKHFRRHSVGWCSQALIRELTRLTPHVHLYVTGRLASDELTQSFEQTVSQFYWPKAYPNGFASAEEITQQIIQDHLDVLVDLDSITVPVNAQILHYSPAPICATWLGFDAPYLSDQHYFLCDQYTHPATMDEFYLEQLIRLPQTLLPLMGFPGPRWSAIVFANSLALIGIRWFICALLPVAKPTKPW
ncbi:MAG: tetratricopeptide repeat protein [Oscillatoriales cyanobacterium RM2_1_1]|nr:tetratricopeptide repeat protein [Oscillatoriales cyanobacterium RM2_1_1]